MPQQQLDDALAQLVHAELIFRRGTPPDAEYTFKHALVQDAAYSTLLRSRRQQLHARIAATLEEPVSGDRGDAARTAGAALCGSGLGREGGRLLAQGRPAGDRTVGDDRGGGAAPEGPRPPFRRARRRCAPGAGARSADRTRTRANCDEGICRAGAGRGVRSRASALRAIEPAGAIGAGSDRPIYVSPRPRGAGPGGTPCRGDTSPGRGPERRDVEMFRLGMQRDHLLLLGKFIDARAYFENALSLWDPTYRAFCGIAR